MRTHSLLSHCWEVTMNEWESLPTFFMQGSPQQSPTTMSHFSSMHITSFWSSPWFHSQPPYTYQVKTLPSLKQHQSKRILFLLFQPELQCYHKKSKWILKVAHLDFPWGSKKNFCLRSKHRLTVNFLPPPEIFLFFFSFIFFKLEANQKFFNCVKCLHLQNNKRR